MKHIHVEREAKMGTFLRKQSLAMVPAFQTTRYISSLSYCVEKIIVRFSIHRNIDMTTTVTYEMLFRVKK